MQLLVRRRKGNQLAVFEDGPALSDDQMQRLAREMNLPETVRHRSDHFRLDALADPGLRAVPQHRAAARRPRIPASGLPVESYTNGPTHVYVVLPDEAAVTALKPHITAPADPW